MAQQGLNTTSAGTKKAGPPTSASLQERADPRAAGTASKGTWFAADSFKQSIFTAYFLQALKTSEINKQQRAI